MSQPASHSEQAAPLESSRFNIADRLTDFAKELPYRPAVIVPRDYDEYGHRVYAHRTFQQLDEEATAVARGLIELGVKPGDRLAFFVPPGLEMLSLVFGLFRSGATVVLIDPGMGVKNLVACLEETDPAGFVAVTKAQAARLKFRKLVPHAKINVCVGKKIGPMGQTYRNLLRAGRSSNASIPRTQASDTAAIIFTSGSTGPPKGVIYEHGMFDAQWQLIQQQYNIPRGSVDLPAFPLFGLFNVAMGVTTVVPEMDFTRPADVDGRLIVEAINDHGVTQCFGSPAFWKRVGQYCTNAHRKNESCPDPIQLPSLRLALSAGAPVPPTVLEQVARIMPHPDAAFHTPYGATESLPACTISSREVLEETAVQTREGNGTCVGRPFNDIAVRVIRIPERPVHNMVEVEEAKPDEIGEIIVFGPSVTKEYFQRPVATAGSKIVDDEGRTWHRIGDVGYFDATGRLWFCGRKNHIVTTAAGPLYPVQCEAIFNEHARTARTALVGVRPFKAGAIDSESPATPVLVVEPEPGHYPRNTQTRTTFVKELTDIARANEKTKAIQRFVFLKKLPVDTRHNVKINREQLGDWAATQDHFSV